MHDPIERWEWEGGAVGRPARDDADVKQPPRPKARTDVAECAGGVAVLIPRARAAAHAPVLGEIGAASPLGKPAYATEEPY